jgi:hypothetical protein
MTVPDAVSGFAGGLFCSARNPRAARLRVQWSVRDSRLLNLHDSSPSPQRLPRDPSPAGQRGLPRVLHDFPTAIATTAPREPSGIPSATWSEDF